MHRGYGVLVRSWAGALRPSLRRATRITTARPLYLPFGNIEARSPREPECQLQPWLTSMLSGPPAADARLFRRGACSRTREPVFVVDSGENGGLPEAGGEGVRMLGAWQTINYQRRCCAPERSIGTIICPGVDEERRSRYLAADELARLEGAPGVPARRLRRPHPGNLHFRPSTNPASSSSSPASQPDHEEHIINGLLGQGPRFCRRAKFHPRPTISFSQRSIQ
jgi:hypothetical protein